MLFLTSLIILICACLSVYCLLCKKKGSREPPDLPGRLPLLGHALLLVGDGIKSYKNITWIAEECMKRGGVIAGYLGMRKAYCITDPEAIVTVSNSCLEKEYIYGFAKAFVGDGLITGNGHTWKRHRKLLNPAFSQQVLSTFIQCFNQQARTLISQLECQLDKPYDHETVLRRNNLESICLTATGVGGEEYTNLQQKYLKLIPEFQMILYERFKQIWYHSDFIYNSSGLKKREDGLLKSYAHLSNQIIEKKKEEIESVKKKSQKGRATTKPFLELILDISKESHCFTDDEIRHETDTIIAAGHETSAACLNLALIALGSYPQMQEKVYEEVIKVFGDSDKKDLDKSDLARLVYTEAVLKETLRLYPVVPVVARNIDRDIQLRNYTLKANSACFLFLNGLNRHSAWGHADQFRPDRWLDHTTLPGRNYFGSFSIGKRNCIGKAYAMMSMKTSLAHIVRHYHITADISRVVFKWHMLTYPASGHRYVLTRR